MTLDIGELVLLVIATGGLGGLVGYLFKQLPLKDVILDYWRERKGGAHRIEQLLRLKQMSDEKGLSLPLKWLRELQGSGFSDQSWAQTFDKVDELKESHDSIEIDIGEVREAIALFGLLLALVAEKSFELAVFADDISYTFRVRTHLNERYRHNFQLWRGVLARLKDSESFRSCLSETLEFDIEQQDEWFALLDSYADYCDAPSPRAFKKWARRMLG